MLSESPVVCDGNWSKTRMYNIPVIVITKLSIENN